MSKKLTTEEFIIKARLIHGDRYNYSETIYSGRHSKLKIFCNIHKEFFEQEAGSHLLGSGCPKCSIKKGTLKRTKTQEQYLLELYKKHGDSYDLSNINYINDKGKVNVICKKCGNNFYVQAGSLLISKGNGCKKCLGNYYLSKEEFIKKANIKHKNKFDYSDVVFIKLTDYIIFYCKDCGNIIKQTVEHHLRGDGCAKCSNKIKPTTNEFILSAKLIHGDKFDYSLVKYETAHKKVNIICKKHGQFSCSPTNHLQGKGCPICIESKGESLIMKILNKKNIININQHRFNECKNIKPLPFDFYIPSLNICIEFDGKQHFQPVNHWGGEISFILNKKRDEIKTQYCLDNGIKLIRIPYTEFYNIEEILNKELNISQN